MISTLTIAFFGLVVLGALLSSAWAMSLVTLMFPLEQSLQASSGFFVSNVTLVNLVTGLSTLVALGWILFRRPDELRNTLTFTLVATVILYVWSALSLVWSPSQKLGPQFVRGGAPYILLFVIMAPILVRDIERLGAYLRLLLYLGTVVVTLMVFNPNLTYVSGRVGVQIEGSVRTNPLAIGELGGSLIILATLLRQGPVQWLMNVARIAAFASGGLLALESGSRGQLIFAIALALFLIPVSKQVKNVFQFIGTLALTLMAVPVILWLAKNFLSADVLYRWSGRDVEGGIAVRLQNWLDLLIAWARSPTHWLQGLGFNAFSVVTTAGSKEEYPHNLFVEVFAEEGLLMFTLLVIVTFRSFRNGLWLFRRFIANPVERASVSALIGLSFYYFLIANKQANLWGNGMMFMFFCVMSRLRRRTEVEDTAMGYDASSSELQLEDEHAPEPGMAEPVAGGATR